MSSNLVYSTEHGRHCPKCGKQKTQCSCRGKGKKKKAAPAVPRDGIVRVGRETKGRKGAGVTIITGIPLQGPELKALAKELKQRCGTGGTIRNGIVEIQGDHRDQLVHDLQDRGYTVKRSGG